MTEMMDEYREWAERNTATCRWSGARQRWEAEISPGVSAEACGHESHAVTRLDGRDVLRAVADATDDEHREFEPGKFECSACKTFPETPVDTVDPVDHPPHYTSHPSGIECIQITEHMGFNLGNALKYIWRCDLKENSIKDLEKARWYVDREIARRKAGQ